MPTYRYRCIKCSDELEVWQSFDEKPKTRHAGGCGGKLTKVMSPAGIVLKGSGFYKTDSRSSSSKGNGKRSSESGSSDSGSSDSGSSDSGSSSGTKTDSGSSSGAKTDSSSTAKT